MRFVKMISLVMADQLRSAVYGSIKQYADFWKQYDFAPWEEGARAGYHNLAPPSEWDPAHPGCKAGKRTAEDANVYWRRYGCRCSV